MTSRISGLRVCGVTKWLWTVLAALSLAVAPRVHAIGAPGPGQIFYNPNTLQTINIDAGRSWSYALAVQSAFTFTNPTTVTMQITMVSAPAGVSAAVATSYVTFVPSVVAFSSPNEVKTVQVVFALPVGAVVGDYQYQVTTSGWTDNPIDEGTYINMHASPAADLPPPIVAITAPANNATYTYTVGGPALPIAIAADASATDSAPVLTLVATISRADDPLMQEVPIALSYTGLGSADAHSTAVLPVDKAGTYTIKAKATNVTGESVTSSQFIVNEIVPPPTVVITSPANNPTYSYVRGVTSVSVPYAFVGTSLRGGITALSATLDGVPITGVTLTDLGQLVATGTGTLTFDASTVNGVGDHTVAVTATDANGEASASATFKITEQVPTITVDIASPLDGAVIFLPPDASPLAIPFSFTSAVTLGGTVKTIAATLASDAQTISVTLSSTSGLNTPTATGAGTLVNVAPGTYTLSATGANSDLGLEAFDSVTFTVTPPPPPTVVFTQAPQPTYTTLTGYGVSIPFAIKTSGTGAFITTQSVTLNGDPVTITSTANGTTLVATGGGTLSIPAPAAGTTTYTLSATGTDTYGVSVSTETTFTVTVTDPVIAIAINSQIVANSPYVLPTSGTLSIPFTFTGTITSGATVDTITGDLGGSPVTISSTTGLGTSATATASGTLTITGPGTYTLTATDSNTKSGASATTSVTFVVTKPQGPPPLTITITQAPLPSYTLSGGCSSLSIPITFVGSSNGGLVKTMTATLDGQPITLSSVTGLNSASATAKATLSVRTAGTHVLVVKATDNYNQTASTSVSFVVVVQKPEIAIVIEKPTNNSVYTLPAGSGGCGDSGSVSIPFSFTATITAGATIDAITATLNGSSVCVTKSGIGTATAKGTGTLTITRTGTYTLTAKGVDTGAGVSATASVTFTVRKAATPTVAITAPTQTNYTAYSNCSPVSVAFAFKGVSESGGITKLSATLDGHCLTVTTSGIGTLTATGSGTMALKSAGKHMLTVSASDQNGSSSASLALYVTVTNPTPTVTISQPADGAVFTYEDGDQMPAIPFVINASANAGATISSLKASLNSNCVDIANTGIGTSAVKGTGTLKICGAGTYTLTATAVSGGVNATAKVTFTVKKLPAPTCTVDWTGPICDGKAKKGGSDVKVQFQVKRQSSSGTTCLRDSAIKIAVCEERSNGHDGDAHIYGSSNYSIDSSNCYSLNVSTSWGSRQYRVDVYSFTDGNKPKLIGSKDFNTK